MLQRRQFLRRTSTQLAALAASTTLPVSRSIAQPVAEVSKHATLDRRVTAAIRKALDYLIEHQSPDGSWRSTVYGPFKDGTALTTKQLRVFARLPVSLQTPKAATAVKRGMEFIQTHISYENSNFKLGPVAYPVYFASDALQIAEGIETPDRKKWRSDWRSYLSNLQLSHAHGWDQSDPQLGGWSYAKSTPVKPADGVPSSPLADPNMSATVAALDALNSGRSNNPVASVLALRFLKQLHNPDGGFHFVLDDFVRNKAGGRTIPGDESKPARNEFSSYGSATCDGLRALLRCGVPSTDPRVKRTVTWLQDNFSSTSHPGDYAADREYTRESVFYYYCSSLTRTIHQFPQLRLPADWSKRVATTLLERQQADGSWTNPAVDVREDDPLVATPLAIESLLTIAE